MTFPSEPKRWSLRSDWARNFAIRLHAAVQRQERRRTSPLAHPKPLKGTAPQSNRIQPPQQWQPPHRRRQPRPLSHRRCPKPPIFKYRPLITWPKGYQPPEISDYDTFVEVHQWMDEVIKTYLEKGRPHWQQLPMDICQELEIARVQRYSAVDLLYANNAQSRINFARIALRHVPRHLKPGVERPVFFVTLTPEQFGFREDEAASFNPRKIQAWTWQVLRGFDFIGMVEAALFPVGRDYASNLHSLRGRMPMISSHVHLLERFSTRWMSARRQKAL